MDMKKLIGHWTCSDGGRYEIARVLEAFIIYGIKKDGDSIIFENIGILSETDNSDEIISTWTDSNRSTQNSKAKNQKITTTIKVKSSTELIHSDENIPSSDNKTYFQNYGNLTRGKNDE